MDGTCLGLMNLFLLKGVRCQDFAEILPPTSYLLASSERERERVLRDVHTYYGLRR